MPRVFTFTEKESDVSMTCGIAQNKSSSHGRKHKGNLNSRTLNEEIGRR